MSFHARTNCWDPEGNPDSKEEGKLGGDPEGKLPSECEDEAPGETRQLLLALPPSLDASEGAGVTGGVSM